MRSTGPISRFVLYGEAGQDAQLHFLHAERIGVRSGRFRWRIDSHAHAELHQVLLVTEGGGTVRIESEPSAIRSPALLTIPAGTVHAFAFAPETDGWVVTVAESLTREAAAADGAMADLFSRPAQIGPLAPEASGPVAAICQALSDELTWAAPARTLALRAELLRLLVAAARLAADAGQDSGEARPADAVLVDRFRREIERQVRRGQPIAAYARVLGVSEDRLLLACRRRLDASPGEVVHRRLVLEAQRWLLHTSRSVGAIALELGFPDPAYFSRFFRRETGETPRSYRARLGGGAPSRAAAPDRQNT